MVTLSMEFDRSKVDGNGHITIPDGICAQAVPSGMGYGRAKCRIVISGKTYPATAIYGRIQSYAHIPQLAKRKN